jgi:opacity protein-like surface antigen
MKTILFAAAASVVAFTAMPAAAQMYVQGNVGYSFSGTADTTLTVDDGTTVETASGDVDLDGGFMGSAAFGTSFAEGLRVESEAIYSSNDLSDDSDFADVSVKQWAVMANVLYDFTMEGLTPYVGAGIGYGSTTLEEEMLGELDDSGLAWQLRAGVSIGEAVVWDIGYRYLNMADFEAEFDDGTDSVSIEADAGIHAVTVGVRIPLGG